MIASPDGLPPLREVIGRLELTARKSLSQNFILDLNLTRRIARSAGDLSGVTVIEVGPGPGGLTRALLLEGAQRVVAIERDERCLPALEEIAARWPGQVEIILGDALAADFQKLAAPFPKARIIANLPYSVATPLLVGWLKSTPWPPWWDCLALMFQREVADRIVAPPGSKVYGRLSVMAQWRASARIAFNVPAEAFTPPPKVSSAIVHISPLPRADLNCTPEALETVTSAAFGQRRKMLRSSLKPLFPNVEATLLNLGIVPTERAETITVKQFESLAVALQSDRISG